MDHVELLAGLRRLRSEHASQNAARDIIDAAITALSARPEGEAVATYMGRRLTPEGTKEFWGCLAEGVEDLPPTTKLYLHPPRSHGVVVDGAVEVLRNSISPDGHAVTIVFSSQEMADRFKDQLNENLQLQQNIEPPKVVVDEAMVERAVAAFGNKDGFIPQERDREHWKAKMHAALVAALGEKAP